MNQSRFPKGWDEERVRKLIEHEESLTEDQQAAEDDAAVEEHDGQTMITVPDALLPEIRQLLANYKSA